MEILTKVELRELVEKVIVAQGNPFIKELLRSSGAQIGATKEDFVKNLNAAIETEIITQTTLEAWLAEVEGWGDQNLYLMKPPQIDTSALAGGIAASSHSNSLDAAVSLDFPEILQLKKITLNALGLSMVWHQRKERWNRWRSKDYLAEEGLEQYRFEAYHQRFDRSIIRFEWLFSTPYCAILIHRNTEIDHDAVIANIRTALAEIGCPDVPFARIRLSQAVKIAATKDKGMHSTRFELDSGYVEMASTLPEGGIDSVEPVRLVLQAVDASQFDRAQGMLHFAAKEHGMSRRVAVQVFGSEAKLRIWAQCKREDIFQILSILWDYNSES